MLDISTDAGRTAKNRAADKKAEQCLRAAVGNPINEKGHPVPGHLLKTIASVRLHRVEVSSPVSIFDELMTCFLNPLTYSWGTIFSVSNLWNAFLELVTSVDIEIAMELARNYVHAFRWCVAGHLHLLNRDYESRPDAIIGVEIWSGKAGCISVAVRRNGEKSTIPPDYSPENPRIVFAGTRVHEFLAPQDWKRLHRIGHKRFWEAHRSVCAR
jgi:hypothetical protein